MQTQRRYLRTGEYDSSLKYLQLIGMKTRQHAKGTTLREYGTRLLMYRMSKSVQQPELYRSVERFCVQRNKKKLSGNFGYMGRSIPWGDLDHMWRVERYGGRNHVCNIS